MAVRSSRWALRRSRDPRGRVDYGQLHHDPRDHDSEVDISARSWCSGHDRRGSIVDVTLHADVVRVLSDWSPPDPDQAQVRERFLEFLGSEPGAVRPDHPGAHITASVLVVDAECERVLL